MSKTKKSTPHPNAKWKQLTFFQWVSHENHPCPIITISDTNEINNYEQLNETDIDEEIKSIDYNICLNTVWKVIRCPLGQKMKFQKNVYKWIITGDNQWIKSYNKIYETTINDIITKSSDSHFIFYWVTMNKSHYIYLFKIVLDSI